MADAVKLAQYGSEVDVDRAYRIVAQFLAQEAQLLDRDQLSEWLDLLDENFLYQIPLRIDRERSAGGNEFVADRYRIRDSKAALKVKIDRLATGHGWAEELPSRTCRLVGSISVERGDRPDVVRANSTVFVFRQRGANLESEVIPARRSDVIRIGDGRAPRLLSRTVLLAEKSLATTNLAIIL